MWLQLLRVEIGIKISCQLSNQWEAKPKQITLVYALSKLLVVATNIFDLYIELFLIMIGRGDHFGDGFSTVNWKPLCY